MARGAATSEVPPELSTSAEPIPAKGASSRVVVLDRRVLQSLYLAEHEALRFAARSKAAGLLDDDHVEAVRQICVHSIERQVARRSAEASAELAERTEASCEQKQCVYGCNRIACGFSAFCVGFLILCVGVLTPFGVSVPHV